MYEECAVCQRRPSFCICGEYVRSIDPALLIKEVKKRPLLYDDRLGASEELRWTTWYEITEIFFKDFQHMTKVEKEKRIREIQSRWKALRDSYRRTIRVEERDRRLGLDPGRRSKYYYFDKLNFLRDHCGPKGGYRTHQEADNSDYQDSNGSAILEDQNSYVQYHFIPVETQVDTSSDEPEPKRIKTDEDRVELTERMVKAMENLADIQKKEMVDNAMGNKSFLLSLLPFMEKLSNEENLQVRVHFMNVLQTYKRAVKQEN